MKFFSNKCLTRYQTAGGKTDWNKLWSAYESYLKSISSQLSPSWETLARADFHDHRILSAHQLSKRKFVMDLETAKLTFTGVKFLWVPKSAVGDRWVYWEVSPSDQGGIDLEVCLANDEIRIVAEDLEIESHKWKRVP